METCSVSSVAVTTPTGTAHANCDDGFGLPNSTQLTSGSPVYNTATPPQIVYNACSTGITDTRYTINGGAVISLPPISPSAAASSSPYEQTSASVSYTVNAYPLTIAAPDPLGRPDLGDGNNQFVYGAQQPDGFLYIPGAIRAAGASHDAMNWLIGGNPVVGSGDKVDLKIENPPISNALTHQWAVSNDTIYVNTPEDTNNPYPQYEFNNWIFKGLPSSNSGFGTHDVNLYVAIPSASTVTSSPSGRMT